MNRRSFLASILAAGSAPLVLRSGIARGIIMPVRQRILLPTYEDFTIDCFYKISNEDELELFVNGVGTSIRVTRGIARYCGTYEIPTVSCRIWD